MPLPQETVSKIQKLPDEVINRIAAGEVVIRPANALKELLENALDADSKRIVITVKEGGLKLLQIVDDGIGIRHEDLPIICERFTTSKLRHFEDLSSIKSFGFRGEALASISHVSNVTITTCQRNGESGHTCQYANGLPLGPIRICAGVPGTTIVSENMFYNLPIRRQALRNTTDEYNRILEVVQRYAIHYPKVSFICRKLGQCRADVATVGILHEATGNGSMEELSGSENGKEVQQNTSATCEYKEHKSDSNWDKQISIRAIQSIYGNSLPTEELVLLKATSLAPIFEIHGLVSSPNANPRKSCLILFINDRLVENNSIKRSIDNLKNDILPKNLKYWIYISIHVPAATIDVNVHPTKKEVILLHEERIVSRLTYEIESLWRSCASSKPFFMEKASVDANSILKSIKVSSPDLLGHTSSPLLTTHSSSSLIQSNKSPSILHQSTKTSKRPFLASNDDSSDPELHSPPRQRQSRTNDTSLKNSIKITPYELLNRHEGVMMQSLQETRSATPVQASSQSQLSSSQVYRTRTDNRQMSLRSLIDIRRTKESLSDESSTLNKGEFLISPLNAAALCENHSENNAVEKDSSKDADIQLNPEEKAPCNDTTFISFRSFLVPPFSSASKSESIMKTMGLRLDTSSHPLESVREYHTILDDSCTVPKTESGTSNGLNNEISCLEETDAFELQSIMELRRSCIDLGHALITEMLIGSTYIGSVDNNRALVQYESNLVMVDLVKIFKEAVYQSILFRFGKLPTVQFSPPVHLPTLIHNSILDYQQSGYNFEKLQLTPDELTIAIIDRIIPFRKMLDHYFGIAIDESGSYLTEFPLCCGRYLPGLDMMGMFFLRISCQVTWTNEKSCIDGICRAMADYYGTFPVAPISTINDTMSSIIEDAVSSDQDAHPQFQTTVSSFESCLTASPPLVCELFEFVFHPSIAFNKQLHVPSSYWNDGSFKILTTLEKLYRVFERC